MASHPGILVTHSSSTVPHQNVVGNGHTLSAQCTDSATVPSNSSPLQLHNVLIAPQLVKILIFVRAITRDNGVSIKFDPWGFFC